MRAHRFAWGVLATAGFLASGGALAEFGQRVWNPYLPGTTRAGSTGSEEALALERVNLRRGQVGLPPVARNAMIDTAARGHSNYLALNNLTGHFQSQSQFPNGFTGTNPGTRITAAGYNWTSYNEVIAFGPASGATAIDNLIEAIYHRFGLFSTRASEVGIGMADTHPSYNYVLTADLATNLSPTPSQPGTWIGVYPYAGQTDTPRDFYSDEESPDPVPGANRVGYPVSLHVDANLTLAVSSFAVTDAAGQTLAGSVLKAATDTNTSASVAAFIPTSPFDYGGSYTARFVGSAGGTPIDKSWSFSTAPLANIAFCPAAPTASPGVTFNIELSGGSGSFKNVGWSNSRVIGVGFLGSTTLAVSALSAGTATITVTDSEDRQASIVVTVQAGAGTPSSACTATNAVFSATVGGTTDAQTIALNVTPASADVGQSRQIFVAAIVGSQFLFNNGSAWLPWNGDIAAIPAWSTQDLSTAVSIPVATALDVRSLCGIDLAVGYGTSPTEMVSAARYSLVHRICS